MPKRKLDFNPDLAKTLTEKLNRPHRSQISATPLTLTRSPLEAVYGIKQMIAPTTSPERKTVPFDRSQDNPTAPQKSAEKRRTFHSNDQVSNSSHTGMRRSNKLIVPQFKSFSSHSDKSIQLSKDIEREQAGDSSSSNDKPYIIAEELVPSNSLDLLASVKRPAIGDRMIQPNDGMLAKCRQMMSELHQVNNEAVRLKAALLKYSMLASRSTVADQFKKKAMEEKNRLAAKHAELKPQVMIAHAKLDTFVSKIDRSKACIVDMYKRKTDLMLKARASGQCDDHTKELHVKIDSLRCEIEKHAKNNELQKAFILTDGDSKKRGELLERICVVARDFGHCTDEEGLSLLSNIDKLKRKLASS